MNVKLDKYKDRIRVLAWAPETYDHAEGYHEVGHIKLSKSKSSVMDDWDLDELLANIQVKNVFTELAQKARDKKCAYCTEQKNIVEGEPGVDLIKQIYIDYLEELTITNFLSYRQDVTIPINYCPMCGREIDRWYEQSDMATSEYDLINYQIDC